MVEKIITVTNEEGLHTRPANSFVKIVKKFQSAVDIQKKDKTAPGNSLLKIMKLGIIKDDEVTLRCDGPDEVDALHALTAILRPDTDS